MSEPTNTASPDATRENENLLSKLFKSISKALPTILVLAVMGGGWIVIHHINSGRGHVDEETITGSTDVAQDTVQLPEGKLKAGRFESVAAQPQLIQHNHTVPGRLRYDQTKHVDVKAPLDGIVSELRVTPGEAVVAGDLIAVLISPEIGQARAEILKRKKQGDIARTIVAREQLVTENLNKLTSMLEKNRSVQAIEAAFANKSLGNYRQEILSSYAKLLLANEIVANLGPLADQGAISGRVFQERENERQLAETAFRTATEQAKYAAQQAVLKAEADVSESERQLILAWQALDTLLGHKANRSEQSLSDESAVSRLEVRAPISGTIESRTFAGNDRVMRGDSLAVLANTDSLSVEASIRESDWSAVALQAGTTIAVTVPALEERKFKAHVRYFGREVQADTNSVPLVAEIENSQGLLRPGMFVRVEIPIGQARQALSVKSESVIQHENKQFVFVDLQSGAFKRVDVSVGDVSDDWVEVKHGVSPGQLVVTQGAFLLKSELLLQGE
jgi:cobalt-zinc-cadmium efflux system membrane fusion protein